MTSGRGGTAGSGKVGKVGSRWLLKEGRCYELRKRGEREAAPREKGEEFGGSQEPAHLTRRTEGMPGLALEWNKTRVMEKA